MVKRLLRFVGQAINPKLAGQDEKRIADEQKEGTAKISESVSSKVYRDLKRSKEAERVIIIDSSTGKTIQEEPSDTNIYSRSLSTGEEELLPNTPEDIVKLAARNRAFFEGILALQRLNLDADLYDRAIESLKRRYYKSVI